MKRHLIAYVLFSALSAFAEENPQNYFQEKTACLSEALGCAREEAECLAKQAEECETDPLTKEITARLSEQSKKIIAATESALAGARSASRKAVQAAEDELAALHDAKAVLYLKREAACETAHLKQSATSHPELAEFAAKVEKSYADLIATEESTLALKSKGQAIRREIESAKRQFRIAELENEKRQLESE